MYTSSIVIAGLTSFIVQLFTKVHCHCNECDYECSCYEKIRQFFFAPATPKLSRYNTMGVISE